MKQAFTFYVTVGLFMTFGRFANSDAESGKDVRYVVYPSKGFEDFYLELNRLTGAKSVKLNFERNVICNAIFKSRSIPAQKSVEVLVIDDSITKKKIYSNLFRPTNNWHLFGRPSFELLVNVSVQQTVREEAVFPCVVKVKQTDELKLYLVSALYDFNRGRKGPTGYPADHRRFVFEYNENENLASMVAIAEQPAEVFLVKKGIQEKLQNSSATMSERSRAICDFTTERKLRLCTIGLNAELPGLTFLPLEDRIEHRCENITVVSKPRGESSVKTGVWAIGCKAEPDAKEEIFQTHYISLGFEPHQFLMYDAYFNAKYWFHSHLAEDNGA